MRQSSQSLPMSSPTNALFRLFKRMQESIAFYPTLIVCAYLATGAALLTFESSSLADSQRHRLPAGLLDPDTIGELLGTLITSIVSLTVFSFSMVMVVLNGAASRLTPRVLPRLITDTRNRVTLGIYLGSVAYFLLLISSLNRGEPASLPSFGTLLAVLFGLLCLALFVVFIRAISQAIQVDWVLGDLYRGANRELKQRKQRLAKASPMPDDTDWECLQSIRPGYLREVNERRLGKLLREHDLRAVLQVEPGFFLIEGHPLIRLSGPVEQRCGREILDCFDFHNDEFASSNVSYGMRQISEIAVKSISPAINDPGTAVRAINLLGVLLMRLGGMPPYDVGCFDRGEPRLFYPQLGMQRMLTAVLDPIRSYGNHDAQVLITLIQALKNALHGDVSDEQRQAYAEELVALRDEADAALENTRDRRALNDVLERLNKLHQQIPPLRLLDVCARRTGNGR